MDVLTTLAHLHLSRYQALPRGQDQDDLRKARALFGVLADRAPERVPDQVRVVLSDADAYQLATEGARAFTEYERTGRPGELDTAVTALQDAVTATLPGAPGLAARLSVLGSSLRTRF
ncbi:MAG: hypothetical protein ACLQDY_21080 [Streptosporangiaceae bacterium]